MEVLKYKFFEMEVLCTMSLMLLAAFSIWASTFINYLVPSFAEPELPE